MTNKLKFESMLNRTELLSSATAKQINEFPSFLKIAQVAEIDPRYAGGKVLCDHYNIPYAEGANCVVIKAIRGKDHQLAACVIPVNTKMDLNKKIRKLLGARRVSLAPQEEVLAATRMEYGSITPIGLPSDWIILVDNSLIDVSSLIMGSGKLNAKLCLPGKFFLALPNAQIVDGLGIALE